MLADHDGASENTDNGAGQKISCAGQPEINSLDELYR